MSEAFRVSSKKQAELLQFSDIQKNGGQFQILPAVLYLIGSMRENSEPFPNSETTLI